MNAYQKICEKHYAGGEYAGCGEKVDGDSLFNFLMRELSTEEGCESIEDARSRLRTVIEDVNSVYERLLNASLDNL